MGIDALQADIQLLRRHNAWRRSLHDTQQDPTDIGRALDRVLDYCQVGCHDRTDRLPDDPAPDVGDPGQPSAASHETEHAFTGQALGYRAAQEDDGEG